MQSSSLSNYIRSLRRSACLTQRELAWLAGGVDHTRMSRYESFEAIPDVQIAMAIAFVFGMPLGEVFPKLLDETEDDVARRAYQMLQELEGAEETVDVLRKREVLSQIPRRNGHPNPRIIHDRQP